VSSYLELEHLTKIFGPDIEAGLEALRFGKSKSELLDSSGNVIGAHDVNLQIERGELFVVMGLSGSGKSTLVRMINRLIEPSAGRVLLDGVDITSMPHQQLVELRRRKMSMVFQSFALLPHLSVIDNVAFGLHIAGVDKKEARKRSLEALKLVGIAEVADHQPDQLSGGMQQRVGLARAWVTEPEIMLMDEAFSALDPLIRTEMQDALLELQQTSRRTIVFISHDLAEAVRIADRIAVMAEGEIRQVGTPAEIIENPADQYVRAFFRDVQPGRLFTAGDIAIPGKAATIEETVPANALLEDILQRAADTDNPLAVADEQGNIIGYIDRRRLLQALAKGHGL
jgi:glycine betaine/proline transport system ATP-binding protein